MIGSRDRARANLYFQLATQESAGVPITRSLARLQAGGGGRGGQSRAASDFRPVLRRIEQSGDLGQAVREAPGISKLEAEIIYAGAVGGTLSNSFAQLAEVFEARAKAKVQFAASIAYPLVLIHAAFFMLNAAVWYTQGTLAFLEAALVPLALGYVACLLLYFAHRVFGRSFPTGYAHLIVLLPLVGTVVHKKALALSLRTLELLYRAGVPVRKAVQTAADVCPNRWLAGAFERVGENLDRGIDLGAAFRLEVPAFPMGVVELVKTGDQTGELDEMLVIAVAQQEAEARQAFTALVATLGGLAFAVITVFIGMKVIGFYSELFSGIDDLSGY